MISVIHYKKYVFGYIIKHSKKKGVNFLTPPNLTHQVGSLNHPRSHVIFPHLHLKNKRRVNYTSEVLIIQKGKLRLDLYSNKKRKNNKLKTNLVAKNLRSSKFSQKVIQSKKLYNRKKDINGNFRDYDI